MRYESRNKKLNRQPGTVKNWIYHRGDIYLANLNPFKGSEQGEWTWLDFVGFRE